MLFGNYLAHLSEMPIEKFFICIGGLLGSFFAMFSARRWGGDGMLGGVGFIFTPLHM